MTSPGRLADARGREWDAATYHRVSEPQVAWGRRVLNRLELRGDEAVLDAGCGTGRLTRLLCERLPRGRAVAVDGSVAMAREAGVTITGHRASVLVGDLLALPLRAEAFDLVFSTATFHWIHDHDALFGELARVLRPGGRLAAQCGGRGNVDRVHELALEAAALSDLRHRFEGWTDPWFFAEPQGTLDRLHAAGFAPASANLEDAPTAMQDRAACGEYLRTVVLRPWLARLDDPGEADRFVDHVLDGLARGRVPWLLDYRRLNLEGRRR